MGLIKCPKCGKDISEHAVKCIHCQFDLTKPKLDPRFVEVVNDLAKRSAGVGLTSIRVKTLEQSLQGLYSKDFKIWKNQLETNAIRQAFNRYGISIVGEFERIHSSFSYEDYDYSEEERYQDEEYREALQSDYGYQDDEDYDE